MEALYTMISALSQQVDILRARINESEAVTYQEPEPRTLPHQP